MDKIEEYAASVAVGILLMALLFLAIIISKDVARTQEHTRMCQLIRVACMCDNPSAKQLRLECGDKE